MSDDAGAAAGGRRREWTYLALLIAGIAVPYAPAVPWLADHGLDVPAFTDAMFANPISAFFTLDVVVAVVALLALVAFDRELRSSERAVVAAGSLAGASVGLPLYLWLRERRRSRSI